MDQPALKEQIMETGRRLWLRGLVAANDGNISCRVDEQSFLITRSGVSKGFLTPHDVLLIDGAGRVLAGAGPASIETELHLALYRRRPDICAILHAHPPLATAFSLAEADFEHNAPDEVKLQLGRVLLIPHGEAGSKQLAENAASALSPGPDPANVGLLARHGAVTLGQTLTQALFRMEALEQAARMLLAARILRL